MWYKEEQIRLAATTDIRAHWLTFVYLLFSFHKAKEAEDDLLKAKQELCVVTASIEDHIDENSDSEENASTHSEDLQLEGINDHRKEEDRLTEAEKNERVQKQLEVGCFLYDTKRSQMIIWIRYVVQILALVCVNMDLNKRRMWHIGSER